MPDSLSNEPKNDDEKLILEYGRAKPFISRVIDKIPRPSILTVLLAAWVGIALWWVWTNHEPWVIERTFSHGSSALARCVSADETRIVVENPSGFVEYELATGKLICNIPATKTYQDTFTFSLDCSRIVDKNAQLWDGNTGRKIADLGGGEASFSPDGKRIVTRTQRRADLYDSENGSHRAVLAPPEGRTPPDYFQTYKVFFSQDSKLVFVSVDDGLPPFHSLLDGRIVSYPFFQQVFRGSSMELFSGEFLPDNSTFVCGNSRLNFINALSGSPTASPINLGGNFWGFWLSPNGFQLAILHDAAPFPQTALTIVDVKAAKILATTRPATNIPMGNIVAWTPDEKQIVLSGSYSMEVFDAKTLQPICSRAQFQNSYSGVVISPDGSRAAAAGPTGRWVALLSTATWKETSAITNQFDTWSGWVTDVRFLGDAKHLLTATDKGTVQLWRLRRPEAIWGIAWLPQFWLAVAACLIFSWSVICDTKWWFRGDISPALIRSR